MSSSTSWNQQERRLKTAKGPLTDLRVVDLTDDHAGAVATVFLGDYGAEVLKLVPRGGNTSESAPAFRIWNRNKRSTQVDLHSDAPAAAQTARSLIDSADVVVESLGPGVADRMGIGWDDVCQTNPGLIYCSVTPYGQDGPLAGKLGYEGLVAAVSGVLTEQRAQDGGPVWNSLPLVGYGTALLTVIGILAALHRREVTGQGQRVDTSLYQGAIAARLPMLVRGEGVQVWDSAGSDPQGALPNYRLYRCADGLWLQIGALVPDFWNKLAIAIDVLDLVTDPRFETAPLYWPDEATRTAAKQLLASRFAEQPRDHWLEVLLAGDVPVSPVMASHELIDHYQVLANGRQSSIDDREVGRIDQVSPPVRMWRTPGAVRRSAPAAGADPPEWLEKKLPTRFGGDGAPAPDPTRRGPLSGLRVLDLSSYLAGPIGPAYLADLGADVIKVEPPGGEGCRMIMMLYLGGNTGKRDLALDIKTPSGKSVLEGLIRASDVVIHNNRVGVAERLGIDYESVRKLRADVVYLQSTAYGSEGPDATRPGFDPLFQSLTGISAAQGGPGRPPVFPKTPICDIATAMLGAAAVLLGLYHRDRTGEGQKIETSLLATGLWLKSDAFVRHRGWSPPYLTNGDNSGLNAAYRAYATRDRHIFVAARTPVERRALARVVGIDAVGRTSGGTDEDEGTAQQVAAVFASRPSEEWLAELAKCGAPAERVAGDNEEGFYANAQAAHLGAVASANYPGFTNLVQPGVLIEFSESPAERRSGSPTCGEHTIEVLADLGHSPDEIDELERAGVIAVYRASDSTR